MAYTPTLAILCRIMKQISNQNTDSNVVFRWFFDKFPLYRHPMTVSEGETVAQRC